MIRRFLVFVALSPLAGIAFAQNATVNPTKPSATPSPDTRLKRIEEKYRRQLVEISKRYLEECDAFKASNQDAAAQQKLKLATARFNSESARITTAEQKEKSTLPPLPSLRPPTKNLKTPTVATQTAKKLQPAKKSKSTGKKTRRFSRNRRRRR